MHFNGTRWVDATPGNVAALKSHLYNIYAIDKNNIWVGGYEYALHYYLGKWNVFNISDSMTITSITSFEENIFFTLGSPWGKDTAYLYHYSNGEFSLVDYARLYNSKFGGKLWIIDSRVFSISTGIISTTINAAGKIDTSGWKKEFSTSTFFTERFVYDNKNIFAVGQWNLIYHWNGTDWKQIFINITNHTVDLRGWFWGVWADGKVVFICDVQNGIVYHGK